MIDEKIKASISQNIKNRNISAGEDISEKINVVVKSNRFGRKVKFKVSQDITALAFIHLVVNVLGLPWSKNIDELMISFEFRYSVIFNDKVVPLRGTFREFKISDGDEVQLSIKSIWTDKLEEIERKEAKMMGHVMYEMGSRMRELQRRQEIIGNRGTLTQSKIKSLADSYFIFVESIGT
ncbi:MAG TPA: hypothetical protein V6C85_17850 [Allocoleopsis sp.]